MDATSSGSGSDPAVAAIAEDVWQFRLERDTFLQLRAGIPVTTITGISLEDAEEGAAFAAGTLTRLDGLPPGLSADDAVTADFLRSTCRLSVDAPAFHWYASPVTAYATHILSFYAARVFAPFEFSSSADVDRYVVLLNEYSDLIGDIGEKFVEQHARGIRLPAPAIAGARASLLAHRAGVPPLLVPDVARLTALDSTRVRDDAERIVESTLLPRFAAVLEALDKAEPDAPEGVGVAQYDGGEDYYAFAVRLYNTLTLPADEIHRIGLEQVAMLTEQMAEARAATGFSGSEEEFHKTLLADPTLYASSPDDVEAKYRRAMERLEPLLDGYFPVRPRAPYGVRRLDPALEAGMTYGIYEPPTPAEPIGLYRFNGSNLQERSLLNAAAIIYHELAPGHHFHIARQSENESLPKVRREAIEFGAFNEGWAEYAASVADEMGLYDEGYDRYGWLVHQRFIAQRLVVDTGMNVLGWPLEKARQYMHANTLESDLQIASETLRYSTALPAQALGYRLGFLKFHEMRARARAAAGAAFDVRDFHEAVLSAGAMPLDVLETLVAQRLPAGPPR